MPGYLHIFRTGKSADRLDRARPDYQINYSIPGNSFVKSVTGDDELTGFLVHNAEVPQSEIDRAFRELRSSGRTTIADVDIPISEAPAMGLLREPSDE